MEVQTYTNGVLVETRQIPDDPAQVNRDAIIAGLTQGLAAMQQIIDAPQVTFTNLAGAQAASQQIQTAIKAEARQLRRLSRLALNLLDASD